ncbi:hypothetical protein [Paenibacillus kobensis]|jgi:hypothetical protein|uniref:hypothetical protein n=1 Tax=Paenibacillus kobensis TaxID=59841 RepID=UPI000FD93DCA|nr:hypothetical protein [Paenibacillus kobensis]
MKFVHPPFLLPNGTVVRTKRLSTSSSSTPIFSRLTVVWVQGSGVPFTTTNFFAQLIRNGRVVSQAVFDPFGVVRFGNITTLTQVSYQLRTFNPAGILQRVRTIPAGVETFAIIG